MKNAGARPGRAKSRGFTLIELLVVVAIVGILAAIALPAYQDYMARAKMTEPMAKLDELKLSVSEFVASNNRTPDDEAEAGIPDSAPPNVAYYKDIAYNEVTDNETSAVGVQLNGAANSSLDDTWIVMTGTVHSASGQVSWICGTTASAVSVTKYLPANCRTNVSFTP